MESRPLSSKALGSQDARALHERIYEAQEELPMDKKLFLLIPLVPTILMGCALTPASIPPTIALPPTPAVTPLSVSSAVNACPEPSDGMLSLINEPMGYCLLYPDGLFRVDPFETEVCLVLEVTALACHSNVAQIEVSDAAGLSAADVADEVMAEAEIDIPRSTTTVAGEEAIVLDGVPAQDLLRDVLIVHGGRLYRLRFVKPDPSDPSSVDRFDNLYSMIINSLTFLPFDE
jgi:hypothetical protein